MFYRLLPHRKREQEVVDPAVPSTGSRDRQFRGLFSGVLLIFALVSVTLLGLLLFLHSGFIARVAECREGYNSYPDMQIIEEQAPYFLQPFGAVMTELYSPDPPEQVQEWLNRARAALQREAVVSGDFRNLPSQMLVVEAAENGGSRVMLSCP
jgi:hypothetical protein